MATEFQTVLDHGTYVLNALVKSDSKTVELFLVGERDGEESRIIESGGKSFYSFDIGVETDSVDVFREEYLAWLSAGGKEKLENVLNPVSVFNVVAVEPDELVMPDPIEEKPKAAAPKKKPAAKAKPKPKAK